jgi:hypothetical protein
LDFSVPRAGVFAAPFFVDPRFAMRRIMRSVARNGQRKQSKRTGTCVPVRLRVIGQGL